MENLKELKTRAKSLIRKSGIILDNAQREHRDLTQSEQEKFDQLHKEIDVMKIQIESHPDETEGRNGSLNGGRRLDDKESVVFRSWLLNGMAGLSGDEQRFMMERRAQSAGTDTAGGFTVPQDFRSVLESALLHFGGMRQARTTVINSSTGAALPMPTVNDTGNKGVILGENIQDTEQDITYGSVTLNSFKYSSRIIRVSIELIEDSAYDINRHIAEKMAERIGRATNEHFTVGTGTGQPTGVVPGSDLGKTGTTGQTTSVIYNDLVDLEHSVNPAYRENAEFMMNDASVAIVKKLVDGNGRPLWASGISQGSPNTLLGYPIIINQDMPVMAANAKSILFGDFSKYMIRDVTGFNILRLGERFADFHQIGFIGFSRHDGVLLDAGTNPIKHYANSAT